MTTATAVTARDLIRAAALAGKQEAALDAALDRAIADGADIPLESLGFDSLGWMEFCIAVEVNSGLELTPGHVAGMRTLRDVEAWLTARLPA
ncbi:acyl carrier protein [Hansschlegelia sp. KR7-227]|uniref:acyl carrier protein n=1 Tax=Hansschlegelia sp. KR7-227 TaxID=3400914 RepID=UPI003C096B84